MDARVLMLLSVVVATALSLREPAAVCFGSVTEWYDFAIFAASAAVLATVITAGAGGLVSVFAVSAAGLLTRLVGALLVGRISDRRGRRLPFLVTTLVTCSATAAVGLLPSARSGGAAGVVGLAVLRLVQAFVTGGQFSTSMAYLFEEGVSRRRGLYGGFYLASAAGGMAVGVAAVLLVQVALTPDQLLSWGWRLPFLAAIPLALVVFGLRRRLEESPEFVRAARKSGRKGGQPAGAESLPPRVRFADVVALVQRRPWTVMTGLLLGGAFSAAVNLWFVYLPASLLTRGHGSASTTLGPAAVGLLICAVLAPVGGGLSDRLGRPKVLIGACAALCLVWQATFGTAFAGTSGRFFAAASIAVGAALSAFVLASYLPEQFAVGDRATGVALTYGLGSAIVGGLAPLVATGLVAAGHGAAISALPILCAVLAAFLVAYTTRRDRRASRDWTQGTGTATAAAAVTDD